MTLPKKIKVEHRGVAERISTGQRLTITTKPIGTSFEYGFSTCNMSASGLLIRSLKKGVPFRENTILEMTVDPDGQWFGKPLAILGKVVRRVDNDKGGPVDLGVSIIHLDGGESPDWIHCVNQLKTMQGKSLEPIPVVEGKRNKDKARKIA